MEASKYRQIKDGSAYNYLMPKAKLTDTTTKKGASLQDTMALIPVVVKQCKWQTEKLAQVLKGSSTYTTCSNIWEFLYEHIRYHKDEENREQIRSPARSWHDRQHGIDCDCYSTFISCLLTNLGIPHMLRITKYSTDRFQHIYPIVPTGKGKYITIDCVTDQFNYETPYTAKQDTTMDLQFLEGFEENGMGSDELGKRGWFQRFTHNALHAFNRFNPVTTILRNGILACMKLNLFKVAQRLKYAYLTEQQAKAKGMDLDKWRHLVRVKDKMANIFYGAGGKSNSLMHAMLKGKGNHNHDVNGLGYIPDEGIFGMDENTPLPQLLGRAIYESENEREGFGELGDPVTATAVGSATGIMGIIAELLKKIGNPFAKKDDKGSEDFKTTSTDDKAATDAAGEATPSDQKKVAKAPDDPAPGSSTPSDGSNGNGGDGSNGGEGSGNDNGNQSIWQKHKWLKPTAWSAAGLTVLLGGYGLLRKGKKNGSDKTGKKEEQKQNLSGLPKRRRHKKKKEVVLM